MHLLKKGEIMEYWKESISSAAEDCGLVMTDEQLTYMAEAIKGSHDCYSLYSGEEQSHRHAESSEKRELEELKRKIQKKTEYENSTEPCKRCATTGTTRDGWGRSVDCPDCNGKGRVPKRL